MSKLGLALDLSSPTGSFCVFEAGPIFRLISERELPGSFTHSESLLSELSTQLSQLKLSLPDISVWVTPSGPGSFTGLRIAYATLKAFSRATSKPIYTVAAPEVRAIAFLEEVGPQTEFSEVDVLTYLTAEKFVVSSFKSEPNKLTLVSETIVQGPGSEVSLSKMTLADERMIGSSSDPAVGTPFRFPLRSRHLRFFQKAVSLKKHGHEELLNLSPQYFGSSHFD